MSWMAIVLVPLISAAIGWFTNWIAIKMLFHPRYPQKILGVTFQGVFPKRQKVFATQLGSLVSDKLISFDDIKNTLVSHDQLVSLQPMIEDKVGLMLKNKLSEILPVASLFVGDKTIGKLKIMMSNEIIKQLPDLIDSYTDGLKEKLDIKSLVQSKVEKFDVIELENLLTDVLNEEFRFIEILGAVVGFIIGILQIGLMYLLEA